MIKKKFSGQKFPIFISTFLAIKRMCNLPVESMTTGGAFWFHDLTIADPTYILPTLSAVSILLIVYVSV